MHYVELIIYERPELTNDVKPGQVLEALPGAQATQTIHISDPPIESSPTNVFGYVRGQVRENVEAGVEQGDTLVERLVPFGEPNGDKEHERNDNLQRWGTPDKEVYRVVGELKGAGNRGKDRYSDAFVSDPVTLLPIQREIVRDQILEFMRERGKKDYVFKAPDGATYSLKDIALSLEERDDSEQDA